MCEISFNQLVPLLESLWVGSEWNQESNFQQNSMWGSKLWEERHTVKIIAEKLSIYNCMRYTLQHLKETGLAQDNKRPGRHRRTPPRQDKCLKLLSLHDSCWVHFSPTNEMRTGLNINISSSIVHRRLNAACLHGRVAAKKPLLRPQNKVKLLKFARQHQYWVIKIGKGVALRAIKGDLRLVSFIKELN